MKKVLLTILIIFSFIGSLKAADYACDISGDDVIYSNSDKTSYISVNINNVEDLSSLRMYIKYDNKLYSVNSCQFLNYSTSTCSLRKNDESLIFYDYSYNKEYSLKDYPFFYASFISNNNTPVEGETTISVYFDEVKDKDNKSINIKECKKTLTFKEGTGKKEIVNDKLDINIKGYKIKFDENTFEYDLNVENDINSLDIDVITPEDYKYTITGASDLNTYGNKVIISVINSKNEESIYTINVIKKIDVSKTTDINKDIRSSISIVKKYLPYGLIIVLCIIVIALILSKKDNNKMDKYLDDL